MKLVKKFAAAVAAMALTVAMTTSCLPLAGKLFRTERRMV